MKEKTVYICEICNGTYVTKELAETCEKSGFPKHFNEFVGKWVLMPIQVMETVEKIDSSVTESKVIWYPARVESNTISSPANFDLLSFLKVVSLSHSLKLSTRSFITHNVVKFFIDFAIIMDESYMESLNDLLVENETCRASQIGNEEVLKKVNKLIEKFIVEKNITLPNLENVEKYEYKSSI